MTTIRNTAIAAVAAITIAAAMASPAQAKKFKHGPFWAGVGTAVAIGAIGAGHGYYGHDGYRGGRHYRRTARRCARRFGWHTWRWERCMDRRGY